MRRLVCPKCSAVVLVAEGQAPACSACGFGAAAAVRGPAGTVGTLRASEPAESPAAPTRRKGIVLAGILVLGILVLGGAATAVYFALQKDAGPLSQEEARARVTQGLAAAGAALRGEPTDDELSRVTMDGSFQGDAAFGGDGKMSLEMEFGKDDAVRLAVEVVSGPITVKAEIVCVEGHQYVTFGADSYRSRPFVDPKQACGEVTSDDGLGDALPFADLEAQGAVVDPRPDGSVVATFTDNGTLATLEVDPDGRLVRLDVKDEEVDASLRFEHGGRRTIDAPSGGDLMPAQVDLERDYVVSGYKATVAASPHEPPLSEMELRIVPYADEDAMTVFGLQSPSQSKDGFTFTFTDADGDGRLSAGDSFEVEEGPDAPAADYVLFDEQAQEEVGTVGDFPVPGPGLALPLLALLGAGATVRCARRGR